MVTLLVVLLLILAYAGYMFERKVIVNPVTVLALLWSMIFLFSSIGKYTIHPAADTTYLLLFSSILLFAAGYYLYKAIISKRALKRKENYTYIPRYNILLILTLLCILYYFIGWVNIVREVGSFNLRAIQSLLQNGEYERVTSSLLRAFDILIISPVSLAIPAVVAADYWYGNKNKILIITTLIMVSVKMLSTANRTTLLMLILFFVLLGYLRTKITGSTNEKIFKRKIRRNIRLLIIIGCVLFVLMTISRGSGIFRNIYQYFAIPPRMFEIWSQQVNDANIIGYGLSSTLGLVYPLFYILKNVFGNGLMPSIIQNLYDWTMLTDTQWVWPGDAVTANAYVSMFWSFYVDAREIGVLLGSFLFGILTSRSFYPLIKERMSQRDAAVYCLIFYSILFSYVRFQLSISRYALALIFVIFITYRKLPDSKEN